MTRAFRRAARLPFFLGTLALLLWLGTATAQAVTTHPFITQTEVPGSEHIGVGIAANNANGHFYVANIVEGAVYNYGPDGKLDPVKPKLTGATLNRPAAVAVDNSSSGSAGTIWVGALGVLGNEGEEKGSVLQYDSTGSATGTVVSATTVPPDGTAQSGGLPPVVNTGNFKPEAIAIDGAGNLYVVNLTRRGVEGETAVIDKFSPSGTFIAQLSSNVISTSNEVTGIAVDAVGNIWIVNQGNRVSSPLDAGLIELTSSGECASVGCAPTVPGSISRLAVERSTGNILLTPSNTPEYFAEYDQAGNLLGISGKGELEGAASIALDETTGRVYVVDALSRTIVTFGPATTLPDAFTQAATGIGTNGATLHGEVGADGGPAATCEFQYVDEAEFQAGGFGSAASVPCSPPGPFTGEALTEVSGAVQGLNGGTTYRFRILGTNSNGANPGEVETFTTGGPTILSERVSSVGETSVRLEATLNPNGFDTSYFFQYVPRSKFEASGFAAATTVPASPAAIGNGSTGVGVAQDATGLQPGTQYLFRVVALTAMVPTSFGPPASFATYPSAGVGLPDERAYEQASPVNKNGSDVWGEVNAVRASESGDAITFYANAGLPGGTGGAFYGIFQADRKADDTGWTTEGLLPDASTGYFAGIKGWSEDLGASFSSAKRFGEPPMLYRRSRGGELAAIASGIGSERDQLYVSASSTGGQVVYFEVAPGGNKRSNAYVWDRATETSALVGVMNDGKAPGPGTFAGPYDWFNSRDPAVSGVRLSYYTQAANALSQKGDRAFFTEAGTGQLYVRLNPFQPQSALNGEGRCTERDRACTVRISAPEEGVPDPNQPAAFVGATSSGNVVYFLSAGKLTADATAANGRFDLYRFDIETGRLTDVTVDSNSADPNGADVQGIAGTVGNGSRIYFVANGQLAPGAKPGTCTTGGLKGECSLYALAAGKVEFITTLDASQRVSLSEEGGTEGSLGDGRIWAPTAELGTGLAQNGSRDTEDGSSLLIRTMQQLTSYPNEGVPELYLIRPGSSIICVSCNPNGERPKGPAGLQSIRGTGLAVPTLQFGTLTRNLSSSGDRVFFDSPDPLVAGDANGVNDVYEWEAAGTGSCQGTGQNGGCLYLISTGTSPSPSYFGDASASGDDVFFFTQQPLVAQDHDELYDVYDAREHGGIPAQNQGEPPICSGEGCLSAPVGSPGSSQVGSQAAQAPNPKPKACKKGFKRVVKKGREQCVRIKHPKRHKKHGKHKKMHGKHNGHRANHRHAHVHPSQGKGK